MLKHILIDYLKDLIVVEVTNVQKGLSIVVSFDKKFITTIIRSTSSIYNMSPYLNLFNSSKRYVTFNLFRKHAKGVSLIMQFDVGVAKFPPDVYVNDAQEEDY
jgi:hypothetical protein